MSGKALVPSGNKPLPRPMFAKMSLGHNELTLKHGFSDRFDEIALSVNAGASFNP